MLIFIIWDRKFTWICRLNSIF